jgi:hypothetical protein
MSSLLLASLFSHHPSPSTLPCPPDISSPPLHYTPLLVFDFLTRSNVFSATLNHARLPFPALSPLGSRTLHSSSLQITHIVHLLGSRACPYSNHLRMSASVPADSDGVCAVKKKCHSRCFGGDSFTLAPMHASLGFLLCLIIHLLKTVADDYSIL